MSDNLKGNSAPAAQSLDPTSGVETRSDADVRTLTVTSAEWCRIVNALAHYANDVRGFAVRNPSVARRLDNLASMVEALRLRLVEENERRALDVMRAREHQPPAPGMHHAPAMQRANGERSQ